MLACAVAQTIAMGGAVRADERAALPQEPAPSPDSAVAAAPSRESWVGAEATRSYASIWTGFTWAPFATLQERGWRLRVVTGAGRYAYDGWAIVNGLPAPARFRGTNIFADALIGYQMQWGALTLKPFAGIGMVQHAISPVDPVSRIAGRDVGLKLALDSWLSLGQAAWLNVDGSWSAVHDTASIKARLGYRVWQDLSVGLEGLALSDVDQEMRRAGVFLRYAWEGGEISAGGGMTGNSWFDTARSARSYISVSALGRF